MASFSEEKSSFFGAIFGSLFALPKWVLVWMLLLLAPINMATLFFLNEPGGILVAALAWAGMIGTLVPVVIERGFSKASAFGHCIFWTILIVILLFARPDTSGFYETFLTWLLVINVISLLFDYVDAYKWLKGDRAVVRPEA